MKYKILETPFYEGTVHEKLLKRSGVDDPARYLNISRQSFISYNNLENIDEAYFQLMNAVNKKIGIGICSDPDGDGVLSSSMLYSYLKTAFGIDCKVYFHEQKEHGLVDVLPQIKEDIKSGRIGLVIAPDSATNDIASGKELALLGVSVIALDHHISEKLNEFAIVVNPQISPDYENKDLSGTGVTFKFLQKIDDENWFTYADKYWDMVAVSIIADSMNIQSLENRAFIEKGLSNIQNKQLEALINKQSFSMNGEVTINGIAFYISPLINAVIRSGSMEEKKQMFNGFAEIYEEFDYEKRDKSIVKETIYERVARQAANSKSRQDRSIEKAMEEVEKDIIENNRLKNKILFCLANDKVEKTMTGLVAMKLSSKYNKPCVLVRDNGKGYLSGSIRNFRDSPLENMKAFLESLNSTSFLAGHANACGLGLSVAQMKLTIQRSNEKLKDFDFSKIFNIDFEFDELNISAPSTQFLKELHDFRFYVGQGISEPLLLLKNIQINSQKISIFGKGAEKNIWKFPLTEEIDVIKFKCDESDYMLDKFGGSDFSWDGVELNLDIICKVGKSDFNGESKYTLIVEDYEVK